MEGLFRQVARLQPTAMACPPNIWNGLYHLYREELKQAERSGKDKSAAEESAKTAIAAMLGPRIKFLVTGGAPTVSYLEYQYIFITPLYLLHLLRST